VVRTGDAPRRYRVVALEVVDAGTTRVVPETGIVSGDGRRLLLVTCWPFGSTRRGTARYVVDCRGEG
jgi:sortase (surface protein transpeptidase)